MIYKIKHISFLMNNEREKVSCNEYGMFVFEVKRSSGYNSKKLTLTKPMTSIEVIKHIAVRSGDPVITLSNGDKMRVYLSGDPSHMVVEAISILETHEIERQAKIIKDTEPGLERKKPFDTTSLEGLFEDFPEW